MRTKSAGTANLTFTSDAQLMQEYLQTQGILVSTQNNGVNQVAAFQNAEGQSEAIIIDPDGHLFHACREPLSDSGWNMYGIGSGFQTIAAIDSATIWATGNDGALWRSDHGRWTHTKTLPSGKAAIAVSAGTDETVWAADANTIYVKGQSISQKPPIANPAMTPVLLLDSSNLLNFFCVDTSGGIWWVRQSAPGGGWGAWTSLGSPAANGGNAYTATIGGIQVGPNQDGRLQVFAIGSDAKIYTIWQQNVGGNWSKWWALGADTPAVASLATSQNQDGRLEIFVLLQDGLPVLHMWQTSPNNGWSEWASLGLPPDTAVSGLTAILGSDGTQTVVVVSSSQYQSAYSISQTGPNQGWTGWQQAGAQMAGLSQPQLMRNQDGHLEVFALGSDGAIWHAWQQNGSWTGLWASLFDPDGSYFPAQDFVVGQNRDGRLEVFARADQQLFHIWQNAPNSGWSGWDLIGAPSGPTIGAMAAALDQNGLLAVASIASDNSLWLLSQGNFWSVWFTDWVRWFPLLNAPAISGAPCGSATSFWAIAQNDGALLRSDGLTWTSQPLPNGTSAACLAVDQSGAAWVLGSDPGGSFFRVTANGAEQMPNGPVGANSAGAASASAVWATAAANANDFALYVFRNNRWVPADAPWLGVMDWNNYPQVSVGRDGSVWLLDGSGNIWRQGIAPAQWNWSAFPARTGSPSFVFVSAARGGGAWGIDASHGLWQFTGSWSRFDHPLPGGAAAQLSAGAQGALWAIDANGMPYNYIGKSWQSAESAFGDRLVQSPTGWALAANKIWKWDSGSWSLVAGWNDYKAKQSSVGFDGSVLILDDTGSLHGVAGAYPAVDGAPAGLVQIAVVNASLVWGVARDSGTGQYALHLYNEGAWRDVTTSGDLFAGSATAPTLSSAPDGTVWLLGTDGVPRRLAWRDRATDWQIKGKTTRLQSIAASNVNPAAINAPNIQEAWGVSTDGAFRRSVGNVWLDAHTALPNGATGAQVSIGRDGTIWALDAEGALYLRQSSQQGASPSGGAAVDLAAGQGGTGQPYLFAIDASGNAFSTTKPPGSGKWHYWDEIAGPEPLTQLCFGRDQDGTPEVFSLSVSGVAYHSWPAGDGWNSFQPLGSNGRPHDNVADLLASGNDASGLLWIFAIAGDDANIAAIRQSPGSSTGWDDWSWLPTSPAAPFVALATGNEPGGAIEVLAIDSNGGVHHIWQTAGGWSQWAPLGPPLVPAQATLGSLATCNQPNGPLYVFVLGSDANIYAINGGTEGWSNWASLGSIEGVQPLGLAAAAGPDGVLALLQGSDGAIYSASLPPGENAAWSAWAPTGAIGTKGERLQNPVAASDEKGGLHLFAAGSVSLWATRPQASSPTGWADWGQLSGVQPWTLYADGPFSQAPVGGAGGWWTVGADGSVQTSSDGASWTTVPFPGAAVGVSTGLDGTIWAATAAALYCSGPGSQAFAFVGSGRFAQAPVGSATALWTVDPDGGLWRSADGGILWVQDHSYQGTAKQVSACADGSIWIIDRDGTASLAQNWIRIMRPTGMPGSSDVFTEVVAGVDADGTRYLFGIANGKLVYSYELGHHAWPEFSLLSQDQISGLGITNQQDTGELIVYALSKAKLIYYGMRSADAGYDFTLQTANVPWWEVSGDLELCAIDDNNWYWFALNAFGFQAGLTPAAPAAVLYSVFASVPAEFSNIIRLPWPRVAGSPFCALLDKAGNIWMIGEIDTKGGTYNLLQLTGAGTAIPSGVTAIAPCLQADIWTPPQPRFYAMAPDTQAGADAVFWMLCWTNIFTDASRQPAWSAWTPLGGSYTVLYGGPPLIATDTLFGIDPTTASLDAIIQNPMTGKWTDGLVKRPSQAGDEFLSISTYQTEAKFVDDNGLPQANLPVTITAESPVEAWVNNTLHFLGPVHGVTVKTNKFGKLRIKTLATGLHTPGLTFSVAGLNANEPGVAGAATVSPSQNVYSFLQGSGSLPVGGGKPTAFTSASVQQLNHSISQKNATTIVTDVQKITAMPSGATRTIAPKLTHADIAAALPGSIFSHLWHDIKHAAESIAHAIEKGVVSAAIDVEKGTVKLTLYIGGKLVTAFDMVIRTVEDAVLAIEAIVKRFITDIEDFIEWLMLLFDWENILRTQRAMRALIEQSIGGLQDKIGLAQHGAASLFSNLQTDFAAAFPSVLGSDIFTAYNRFDDLPTSISSATGGTALSTGTVRLPLGNSQPVAGSSSAHHNWLIDKILDALTPGFSTGGIPGFDPAPFLEKLNVQNAASQIWSAAQDLMDFFKTIYEDPKQFAGEGIADLLKAAKSLMLAVIDLIEDLVEDFLGMISDILGGIQSFWQGRVDIPVIDSLFEFLTGEDMNLLNLGTLCVAVPLYLMYEIAFNGMPFGNGEAAAPEAIPWSKIFSFANCYTVLGVVNLITSGLSDLITYLQTPDGNISDYDEAAAFITTVTSITQWVMQILAWPDPNGPFNISDESPPGVWAMIWLTYASYWALPLVAMAFGPPSKGMFGGNTQSLLNTLIGGVAVIAGLVAVFRGTPNVVNATGAVDTMISPIGSLLNWLLVDFIRQEIWDSSDLVFDPALIVLIVDAIVNLASPILYRVSLTESE